MAEKYWRRLNLPLNSRNPIQVTGAFSQIRKNRAEIYQAYQGRNVSELFFDDTKMNSMGKV